MDLSSAAKISSNVTELQPLENLQVQVLSVPFQVVYLLFAVHSHNDFVTMSLVGQRPSPKGTFVTGQHVGLVVYMKKNETSASVWIRNNNAKRVKVLITISMGHESGE